METCSTFFEPQSPLYCWPLTNMVVCLLRDLTGKHTWYIQGQLLDTSPFGPSCARKMNAIKLKHASQAPSVTPISIHRKPNWSSLQRESALLVGVDKPRSPLIGTRKSRVALDVTWMNLCSVSSEQSHPSRLRRQASWQNLCFLRLARSKALAHAV